MKLEIQPFTLRLKKAIQTARGPMDERVGFKVGLRAEGVLGRGDAMPMASFGTETPEAALAALQRFEVAKAPDTVDGIAEAIEGLATTPAARHAAECALLEHLAIRTASSSRRCWARCSARTSWSTRCSRGTTPQASPLRPSGRCAMVFGW